MSEKKSKLKPVQPGGVRDYLPKEMIARLRVFEAIERVYQGFGFDPLETPGLERREVLTGDNPDFSMVIFRTYRSDTRWKSMEAGAEDNALRFDLTVPLARVVAANLATLQLPFKRYQVGKVWRGEKPQAGRFSEFTQFDADIVGADSPLADAEIVALIYATMRAVGFERFRIRVNNRKLLNALSSYAGFDPSITNSVLRVLDKLDAEGLDKVKQLLGAPVEPLTPKDEPGLALSEDVIEKLVRFVQISGLTTAEVLSGAEALLGSIPIAKEGIDELRVMEKALKAMDVPDSNWIVDLSVARGLDYYTGPVFETVLTDLPEVGSVFSGGRFDGLVSRFTDATIPATGASIGVDRLFYAMEKLGLISEQQTVTQVLVTVLDPKYDDEYLKITQELRNAGIRTALYLGERRAFKAQISYAAAKVIPVVIILGQNEFENGTIQIKDMAKRVQRAVPRGELVSTVLSILS